MVIKVNPDGTVLAGGTPLSVPDIAAWLEACEVGAAEVWVARSVSDARAYAAFVEAVQDEIRKARGVSVVRYRTVEA